MSQLRIEGRADVFDGNYLQEKMPFKNAFDALRLKIFIHFTPAIRVASRAGLIAFSGIPFACHSDTRENAEMERLSLLVTREHDDIRGSNP